MNDTEKRICENCGCTDEELFAIEIDGETRLLCADCAEAAGFVRCEDCGAWIPEADSLVTAYGEIICEECYDSDYFTCEDCGDIYPCDDLVEVNPGTRYVLYVCEHCARRNYYLCDDCERYFDENHIHSDDVGTVVCDDCYDDHYVTCYDCGRIVHLDDAYWSERYGAYVCDDCYEDERPNGPADYSYKPEPEFHFTQDEREPLERKALDPQYHVLTFGLELEVDNGYDAGDLCDELSELGQPIYMKHDGSLNSEGVEIVTHPCSLAYHTGELDWAAISDVCRRNGYRSHDTTTCGLHIHVGRKAMGPDGLRRLVAAGNLVILARVLWEELSRFSRRERSRLDRWASCPGLDLEQLFDDAGMTDEDRTRMALNTEYAGRYQGVNLCNYSTVEFRIFRGTLNVRTILASIQLVSNLTRYAMTHTPTECRDATWQDILDVERYDELTAYCEERGL